MINYAIRVHKDYDDIVKSAVRAQELHKEWNV